MTLFFLGFALAFPVGCFGMSAVGLTWRIALIRSSSDLRVLFSCACITCPIKQTSSQKMIEEIQRCRISLDFVWRLGCLLPVRGSRYKPSCNLGFCCLWLQLWSSSFSSMILLLKTYLIPNTENICQDNLSHSDHFGNLHPEAIAITSSRALDCQE